MIVRRHELRPSLRPLEERKECLDVARHRLLVATALFAIAFSVIGLRLIDIGALRSGAEPRLTRVHAPASFRSERAEIRDRNGVVIATNLVTASLYANPRIILDADQAAVKLAALLPKLRESEIRAKLQSDKSFVWLRRHLSPAQHYAVNRLGIPGLDFRREERRVYPLGGIAAHVIGFTDIDNRGLAGIELSFDRNLLKRPEPVTLSLDSRIQHILRNELDRALRTFRAIGGAGIVLNAQNGEVIAMASLPDFKPGAPAAIKTDTKFNRSTLGLYEMGSTFKIFTTAIALDSGRVTMSDGYDATNPIKVSRFTIRDFHGKRRWLSVPEIFMYSSNIGAVKMALDVGGKLQRAYLGRLGLLSASPIELSAVGPPLVPSPWREINTMTIAFGHGIAVSPLQLASAVAAAINGGIYYPPTLIKHAGPARPAGRRVFSSRTSADMRRLLRLVVEQGTGRKAAAPGYLVGGKTGTAEKPASRRYNDKALVSSFVAAFPMSEPRYVVFVLLDEPKGTKETKGYATGGWVAAPAVSRIITRAGPILGMHPMDENAPAVRRALRIEPGAGRRRLASF